MTNTEIWPYIRPTPQGYKELRPVTAATKPKIVLITITSYRIIDMKSEDKMPASLQTIHLMMRLIFTDVLLLVFSMCLPIFFTFHHFFPSKSPDVSSLDESFVGIPASFDFKI